MSELFEIQKKCGKLARTGVIRTDNGEIKTPAYVGAATRASVKAIPFFELEKMDVQAILVNTYHLFLRPGTEMIKKAGGVAKFSGWKGATFSDSGGFQIFSLPGVKISEDGAEFRSYIDGKKFFLRPEDSMRAQWEIGADIHMAFDWLAKSENYDEMKKAEERTEEWLVRCAEEHKRLSENPEYEYRQFLYGVVQGGKFLDLREKSARFSAAQEVDGFGIGGVFKADEMPEMLLKVDEILPEEKPRHLLGMGQEPIDFFLGVEGGIDTFDCVGPTRLARNGSLYTHRGRININNSKFKEDLRPIDPECACPVCERHTRQYLHHLFNVNEITAKVLASIHNEYFVVNLVDEIREALEDGNYEEFKKKFLVDYYNH